MERSPRRTGYQRLRLLRARLGRAAQACHRSHPQRTELAAKPLHRLLRKPAKHQRRLNRLPLAAPGNRKGIVILSGANGVPGQLAGWGRKNPRISLLLLPVPHLVVIPHLATIPQPYLVVIPHPELVEGGGIRFSTRPRQPHSPPRPPLPPLAIG